MIYREEHRDLFSVNFKEYTPAHCISLDCKMGAGIAVLMKKKFNLGGLGNKLESLDIPIPIGTAIYHNGVYNLITKKKYYGKPTYVTLTDALVSMLIHMEQESIYKIVMPKIGSGLDKLQWPRVREIIQEVFINFDEAEILVCYK